MEAVLAIRRGLWPGRFGRNGDRRRPLDRRVMGHVAGARERTAVDIMDGYAGLSPEVGPRRPLPLQGFWNGRGNARDAIGLAIAEAWCSTL